MSYNSYEDQQSKTVMGPASSYVTLMNYNNGIQGMAPPVPPSTSAGFYVVPAWDYRLTYNTLVKGGNGNGYTTITSGYGADAGACNPQYVQKPCT